MAIEIKVTWPIPSDQRTIFFLESLQWSKDLGGHIPIIGPCRCWLHPHVWLEDGSKVSVLFVWGWTFRTASYLGLKTHGFQVFDQFVSEHSGKKTDRMIEHLMFSRCFPMVFPWFFPNIAIDFSAQHRTEAPSLRSPIPSTRRPGNPADFGTDGATGIPHDLRTPHRWILYIYNKYIYIYWLVVGIPTPPKNMNQLGWWHSQDMESHKNSSSKPPTSFSNGWFRWLHGFTEMTEKMLCPAVGPWSGWEISVASFGESSTNGDKVCYPLVN